MAGRVSGAARLAAALYGAGWEVRRRAYAAGWRHPETVGARVVSIGNLTAGGTGKTTLTLHLARRAGAGAIVVCRRYRPGRGGLGDEERMYREALGPERVLAGRVKLALAREAAARGAPLVLVDDGFSHWALARDLDIVLLDSQDPFGGGALLPAGRLREPLRALQRAGAVVVSRLDPGEDPAPLLQRLRSWAPAAHWAAGRHRVCGARGIDGSPAGLGGRVRLVTGTGSPGAVERTAREAGFAVVARSVYRDHHPFTAREAARERARAAGEGARVLVTTKDAVRWPPGETAGVLVLEVDWEWVAGGETLERMVFPEEGR